MLPSIWNNNWIDDLFDRSFRLTPWPNERELYGKHAQNLMKTDVRETEDGFHLDIDLPGYTKEDIKGEIKDGYLTLTAYKATEKEEKSEEGKYIRRERYSGHCSRSFYVGDIVTEEDIQAKFADGILKVEIPKKEYKPEIEEKKYISIG